MTTKITLVTEKQNLTQIDIRPFSENKNKVLSDPRIFATSIKKDDKLIQDYNEHPVLNGFIEAYRNHRPVTISPDIIWLLIVQAFATYVENYSERLRAKFVNFEGQKELIVDSRDKMIDTMTVDEWNLEFPKFTEQIKKFVGEEVVNTLTPDFTTTTPVSLSVAQISIMSAFKNYFTYVHFFGVCDFPFVNVEGTIEDWEKIESRLDFFDKYDFDFWTKRIRPIISKIVDSKKGYIDREFWMNMIKIHQVPGPCGGEMSSIDGWFISFFPFNTDGVYIKGELNRFSRMASELLKVPVKIKILNCDTIVDEFYAEYVSGFVGLSQDPNDSSLKPEIGWFIRRADDIVENARKKTTDDGMKQYSDQLKLRSIQ